MARPSRNIDQALLRSGRVLFPQHGCGGLSLRAVAEHAGVNVGMFHYHFRTKDNFLRALLQQMYEEMFEQISGQAKHPGPALARLRQALLLIGRLLREHGDVIGRVWADAADGAAVARDFIKTNAPRHLALLLALMDEAERDGELVAMPGLQRFTFVMGAVAAPVLVAQRVLWLGAVPAALAPQLAPQVLSDDAIAARVDMALAALRSRSPKPAPSPSARRSAHAQSKGFSDD
jgi:AcrR family transcriptional regulator